MPVITPYVRAFEFAADFLLVDAAAVLPVVVEELPFVVGVEPSPALRVAWPKLAFRRSHQRPTVVKSDEDFPASSLIVSESVVAAEVTCSLEIRKPSLSVPSVVPHQ